MKAKPINSKTHALLDYLLTGSLLVVPHLCNFNKTVKKIYAMQALVLLPYIALTKHPLAIKGVIPFKTHGKIDPFNVAQFAALSFTPPFRKNKRELAFNIAFTVAAGIAILLTDWNEE
jgi:hypothetical protein